MTLTRAAADSLLSVLDFRTRGGDDANVRAAKPAAEEEESAEADGDPDVGEPLPSAEDLEDVPEDPEEIKDLILTEIREQLDWDGKGGDPNAAVAALEDSLADMFDAAVDIKWDGKDSMTLRVEGEEPVPLTADYLGELLEALAKQGGEDGADDDDGPEADGDDEPGEEAGQRGYDAAMTRSGLLDKDKHLHAPKGVGGGRFVSKPGGGDGVGGAVKKAAGAASGKGGGGPKASALAARAKGRGGRRATAKAIGGSLSAGTDKRVKVSGNKDGTYNVGPLKKKKMVSKNVAVIVMGVWLASAAASTLVAVATGGAAAPGALVSVIQAGRIRKELKAGGS